MYYTRTFQELMDEISDCLSECDGDYVATIVSKIIGKEVKYIVDSLWEINLEEEN